MRIFVMLIFLISGTGPVLAQWSQLPSCGTNSLKEIRFINPDFGWTTANELGWGAPLDSVYKTNDGGESWETFGNDLLSVYFTDQAHGWAGRRSDTIFGYSGIWNTIDSGNTWNLQADHQYNYHSSRLFFTDTLHGWLLARVMELNSPGYSRLYRTSNGGASWENPCVFWPGIFTDLFFLDSLNGWTVTPYAAIDNDTVFGIEHTSDGGITWQFQPFVLPFPSDRAMAWLKSVHFTDTLNGWIAGRMDFGYPTFINYGIIYHTADGGNTWQTQISDSIHNLNDIWFVNNTHGWAVGDSGVILHTSDGGIHWQYQESTVNSNLCSVSFIDAEQGWICGDNGVILRTDNGGLSAKQEFLQEIINISPNPSTSIIRISAGSDIQHIEILDLSGKLLLAEKNVNSIDISSLKPGIYIATITTRKGVATAKIIRKN